MWWSIGTGSAIGILAVVLTALGNPANMGLCAACFLRDVAGGLGLHSADKVQYLRPEIIGFVLGAFLLSLFSKGFKVSGGSSPMLRFVISIFMMFGSLVFLGCPLRMVLRIAAGDLNAVVGLVGFVTGIYLATIFLKRGFTLGKKVDQAPANGYVMPAIFTTLLVFLFIRPAFIHFSAEGPGAAAAPMLIALAVGLLVGALAYKSRFCTSGGIRDFIITKDPSRMLGLLAVLVLALIGNLVFNNFNLGFEGQPIAHTDHLWNFLSMGLVGYSAILISGCPLRQLILAGSGDTDAAVSVVGLIVGAALAHNFGIAASAEGVPLNGQIAVVLGFIVLTVIALTNTKKQA